MTPRRTGMKGAALTTAIFAFTAGIGLAFWGTASVPGGGGASAATTVNAGQTPSAVVTGTSITVSWAASTMSNGAAVTGYVVKRYDAATLTQQTILNACTGVVTATTCTEASVPAGSWRYSVTPVVGTNWVGTESAKSPAVTTDSTPPVNNLSISVTSGSAVLSGTTIYYRGTVAGSLKIVNALTDTGSGPAASSTSALSGNTTGFTHTTSTVSTPSGGPYTSNAFSWAAGTTSSPVEIVTGADVAGNTTTTTVTFVNDTTGPSGGSVGATGLTGTGSAYSSSTTLNLFLAKGTDPNGVAPSGAQLYRATATLTSNGTADGVCGTFGSFSLIATDPAATRSDVVTDQACYMYQYVVSDNLGNTTTYASAPIKVDTTAPSAPNLTFAAGSNTYWSGTGSTIYYQSGASSGGFTVTATGTDTGSGIASYSFPALGTNWTGSASGTGVYTYSWSGTPAAPGTKTVTDTNNAGLASATSTAFTLTADNTPPTTGTISYSNGYQSRTTVPVTFTTGTDSGSGIGTRLLQRASATMTFGACGTFGSFTTIATNPTSPYTDTVAKGTCYKYQYVTSDNVGNTGTPATSNSVVMVTMGYYDTVMATSGLTDYWRLGDVQTVSDSFTGTAGTTLQAHTGESGATWTKNTTMSTGDAVLTAAGRLRKNGTTAYAVYYASGAPSTANYTVEADLTVLSGVSNDRAGVLGRINTSSASGTFYAGVYDRSNLAWRLYSVVNGTWTSIGSSQAFLSSGSTYHLALQMNGTSIKLLVNGTETVSATSSTITAAGRAGVEFGNGSSSTETDSTGMHLDNIAINPKADNEQGTILGDYFGVQLDTAGAIYNDADYSIGLDGTDYVNITDTLTGDFSIEYWFKSTGGIGTGTNWWEGAGLVDASNNSGSYLRDWGMTLRSDGKIIVGNSNDSTNYSFVSTTGGYNDGNWHQVVFTRSQSTGLMTLYVDAVAVGSMTGSTLYLNSPTINFGRVATGGNYLVGNMDDVSFYSGVLSAATVQNHYAAGTS